MTDLNDSFAKLLGRQPSDEEIQTLYRVKDALNLKNNDALWLVLIALQYYQWEYEKIPKEITRSAKYVLSDIKATADAAVKASAEAAKADLAKAVATAAQKAARQSATTRMMQTAIIAVTAAFTALAATGWLGYTAGEKSGMATGYSKAQDEKAAASWANTPEGQLAYALARAGSIQSLAKCDKPGWKIESGACFVRAAPDGNIYGWKLPADDK